MVVLIVVVVIVVVVVVVVVVVLSSMPSLSLSHVLTCVRTQCPLQTLVGNPNRTHVLAVVTSDAVLTLHSLGIFTAGRGVLDPSLAVPEGTLHLQEGLVSTTSFDQTCASSFTLCVFMSSSLAYSHVQKTYLCVCVVCPSSVGAMH